MLRRRIIAAATATVLALGMSVGGAGAALANSGSDGPTPYTVDTTGVTLPSGDTFVAGDHVNIKTSVGDKGLHFENNGSPDAPKRKYIGASFIPWSAFELTGSFCVTWVQVAGYNQHFGEGGQQPVCVEGGSTIPPAGNEKKVYVCKYVGTPGVDERLQTGQNPIEVSVNAIQNNQWDGVTVPAWFSDAQNRSYVLQYSEARGDGQRDEPTVADCPRPEVPPTPECITAVWQMPSWIGDRTPTWPQALVASYPTDCYNLNVVVPDVCGTQYQVDSYLDNATTTALLEGGVLNGANDPKESFPKNPGWGKTYKLVKNDDCPPPVAVPITLTYMTACAPDDTNTWRVTNPSDRTITVSWRNASNTRSGTHTATPGQTTFDTPRGNETMIITWGGGDSGIIAGDTRKAAGNDEDCSVAVALTLTYMTACAPDDTNTWRVINPSDRDIVVTWTAYGTDRTGQFTAKPGENTFETDRGTETMVISWGGDAFVKKGSTQKASGVDQDCSVSIPLNLTYMTACAPDDTNTWRITNPSATETITVSWRNAANTRSGTHEATPGQSIFETPRGTETMIITWGDGVTVKEGKVTKASGKDQDCSVPVAISLTYMTACAPDDTNTWRITNPSERDVVVTWTAYGTDRTGQVTAKPGQTILELPRTSETLVLTWGGDAYVKPGKTTKASGVDIICDEISFQDVVLECDGTPGSYTLPNLPGVTWTVNGVEKIPGAHALVDAGEITVVATAENGYRFPDNATSKTFTFAATDEEECIEPTLEGSIATTACETDVPYILFSIELNDPDNQSTAGLEDAEILFSGLDSEGNEREYVLDNLEGTLVDGVFSGRVLWPGAAIVDGQAAGWPGWELVDGEWQNVGDDNFGWTRGLDSVTLSVNPTLEVELSYPAATPDCATEPTAVEPTVEYSYSCLFGGTIELSDTPGVIWTVNGEQTDQRTWVGQDIEFAPVITASLDPEMPGLYFGPEAVTETTVEFELPEAGCDLVTSPLVTPLLSSKQATCTTAGSYTLNAIEGVQWLVNGQVTAPGTYTATTGSTVEVEAVALQGFGFGFETQTEWTLSFPAPAAGACDLPTLSLEETDLPTLALTGASGMLGTVGIIALLITLTGIGAVVARRRVEA